MPIKDIVKRRENHNRYMREVWYPKNRQKHIRLQKQRKLRYIDKFRILKSERGCLECGEKDPRCLDWHHVDPKDKLGSVREMAWLGWALDRIMDEIKKCIVLCSNCHRKHHCGVAQ